MRPQTFKEPLPHAPCFVGNRHCLLVPLSYFVDDIHIHIQLSADIPATDALFKENDGPHTHLHVGLAVGGITENHKAFLCV